MIETHKNRQTGTMRTVARASEVDLDSNDGVWVTLCDDHGYLVFSDTHALAAATYPLDFCAPCQRLAGWDLGETENARLDRELEEES